MATEAARRQALRPEGLRSKPVRMAKVFDDPDAVLRLIDELAPYDPVGTYFNGGWPNPDGIDVPWFLVEPDSELLVHNPHWVTAAKQTFAAEIVRPIRCVVNVNPPAAVGPPHIDLPVFRGFSAPDQPIWLLMSMAHSRLFFDWMVPLASGIAWFWRGEGGEFEYWPDGLQAASVAERPPLWNVGVMSDNEVMWHRVGGIGTPARQAELAGRVPATSQMHGTANGWEIRHGDTKIASYTPDEVRLSLVWKGYVFRDEAHLASFENRAYDLDLDQVVDVFQADLAARGVAARRPVDPLKDDEWRQLLERIYRSENL